MKARNCKFPAWDVRSNGLSNINAKAGTCYRYSPWLVIADLTLCTYGRILGLGIQRFSRGDGSKKETGYSRWPLMMRGIPSFISGSNLATGLCSAIRNSVLARTHSTYRPGPSRICIFSAQSMAIFLISFSAIFSSICLCVSHS